MSVKIELLDYQFDKGSSIVDLQGQTSTSGTYSYIGVGANNTFNYAIFKIPYIYISFLFCYARYSIDTQIIWATLVWGKMKLFQQMLVAGASLSLLAPVASQASQC